VAADPSHAGSLVQRLVAAGYDWLFDRVDPLGGADHAADWSNRPPVWSWRSAP
jgi:hypothetical protein